MSQRKANISMILSPTIIHKHIVYYGNQAIVAMINMYIVIKEENFLEYRCCVSMNEVVFGTVCLLAKS